MESNSTVREWALTKLSFKGHKARIKKGLEVIDEAMDGNRQTLVGGEEPDHRVRLMAAKMVIDIYGLEADRSNRLVVVGDPDNPLQLSTADRSYLEKVIGPNSPKP